MASSFRLFATTGAALAVLALAWPLQAQIVSANPHHPTLGSGGPPLAGIAQLSGVDVNAYHVSSYAEVTNALSYSNYGKPKILSDDAGGVVASEATDWIDSACAAGEHYEHFDGPMTAAAVGGTLINAESDFTADAITVLEHIRDSSCVSSLTPWGTLSRSGTEFYWTANNVTEQVTLVGHSWMGAMVGKNFDINGYLDVLADHDVNLTRIWVIEQWTGFLWGKSGAPHPSNAYLPFTGSMDLNGNNDTLNLEQVSTAFLNRLEQFVDAAAARGIVVQLTLFDRHGLKNTTGTADWPWSPYNDANNWNLQADPGNSNKAPSTFAADCPPGTLLAITGNGLTGDEACVLRVYNDNLIKEIVQRLDGSGNVIYEIMNEPRAQSGEWTAQEITDWHAWVASRIRHWG